MMEDSYVETKVEALEDNRTKVTVTVDAADIDARIKKTYKDFANKYNFPGFRKGKAPRPIIDNALGAEAVRATVTDDVVNGTYPLAIDDCDLYPIAKPEFDETDLVEAGKPYTFSFTVTVKPEIEISSYEPVEIELPAEGTTDAEIDEQIDALREHYYSFEDASAATKVKEDSYIDLAMKATDDKGEEIPSLTTENRPYGLGANLFPAEFDEQLVGLKKGQTATFTLDMPADPPIMLSALAGKTEKINFEVEVKVVKKKIVPEVNDEWAKEQMGFESVEDLRARIAESVTSQKADMMPRLKENACLYALAERVEGDVPEAMLEDAEASLIQDFFQQLQSQGMTFDVYLAQQGITPDQFKEDVKKQAEDMSKQDLALDALGPPLRHGGYGRGGHRGVREERRRGSRGSGGRVALERPAAHGAPGRDPHEGREGHHGQGRRDRARPLEEEGRGKEAGQEGCGQEDGQEGRGRRRRAREEARQEGRSEEGCEEGRGRRGQGRRRRIAP